MTSLLSFIQTNQDQSTDLSIEYLNAFIPPPLLTLWL